MRSQASLVHTVIFSLVFSIVYLVIVLTLLGTWDKPAWQDTVPDLIIFIICISGFSIARNMNRTKGRNLLMVSLALNAVVRLIRVPMGEAYTHGIVFDPFYWNIIWFFYFIAVLLLLMGLKKAYE